MATDLVEPCPARDGADGDTLALLSLRVADQLCGVPVPGVRDVLGPRTITRIPLAPPEIAGSLNLRGRIVTAIDLRRRLRLPDAPAGAARMSVVVEHDGELYALLVDEVGEVMTPDGPPFGSNVATLPANWAAVTAGIHRLPGRLMVILDVARLSTLRAEPG